MTYELVIAREARADIAEAVDALRAVSPRLVVEFGTALEAIYRNIIEYPEIYPVVHRNFRRGLLRRFPYSVFYVIDGSRLVVVAVVHQARDESTWKLRS